MIFMNVPVGGVSAGWKVLSTLTALHWLGVIPSDGGRDLSFLAACPSLTSVFLPGCTALSDLSGLVSASRLREVNLADAKHPLDLDGPVNLSPLARTDHRLRVHLRNTATVGDPGPLVKIRKL